VPVLWGQDLSIWGPKPGQLQSRLLQISAVEPIPEHLRPEPRSVTVPSASHLWSASRHQNELETKADRI